MLRETGLVTAVEGSIAQVETKNQLACSSCQVSTSCGNGIVEKYLSGKIFTSELLNTLNAQVGDKVILEIPKESVTKASIVVYLIPLFMLLIAAIIGHLLNASENHTILAALSGLILGLLVTKYYNRRWLNNELYLPKMVSIVDTAANSTNDSSSSHRIHSISID